MNALQRTTLSSSWSLRMTLKGRRRVCLQTGGGAAGCLVQSYQPATGAAETVLLCHHPNCPVFIYNCLVQLPNQTSEDYNGQSGLLRGLSAHLYPASKIFISPEWGKGLRKSLWTPHTQLTLSLSHDTCTFTVLPMVICLFCIFLFYYYCHSKWLSILFIISVFITLIICCLNYVYTFCTGSS